MNVGKRGIKRGPSCPVAAAAANRRRLYRRYPLSGEFEVAITGDFGWPPGLPLRTESPGVGEYQAATVQPGGVLSQAKSFARSASVDC